MDNLVEIFPWNDKFSIGIEQLDEQHHRLIDLLNRLAGRMSRRVGEDLLQRAFDDLTAYALFHFESEEAVWHSVLSGDAWEAEHQQTHEKFVSEVLRIKALESSQPRREVQDSLLSFLVHWLVFHILESDKLLAKVVISVQNGLSLAAAKEKAGAEMSNATEVLINAVLAMNNDLSDRSFTLQHEIEERRKTEASLTEAISLNHALMNAMQDGFSVHDVTGEIIEANPALCAMTGFSRGELLGLNAPYPFTPSDQIATFKDMRERTERGETGDFELTFLRKNGTTFSAIVSPFSVRDAQGKVMRYAATVKDITERKQLEEQSRQQALYDALTKLPNRRLLTEHLTRSMAASQRYGHYSALMFLDLDNFKPLNDRHGHAVGDLLLVEVARRLTHSVRVADTVARIGGDEFVVMIDQLHSDPTEAQALACKVAEKIRLVLNEPYHLQGVGSGSPDASIVHQCSASIGVALFLGHQRGQQEILVAADQAMYRAKALGRNQIWFHTASD